MTRLFHRGSKSVQNVVDLRAPARGRRTARKKIAMILGASVIVTFVGVASFLVWHNHQTPSGKAQLDQVIAKVGRLYLLPTNETPTLATISDPSKLSQNTFLRTSGRSGDKVLVYVNAGRAILYRPSINKIIDVGPVVVDKGHQEAQNATITIEDSTNRPNLAAKMQSLVQQAYPEAKIKTGGPTARSDFPETIVIDNTDQKDNLVNGLAAVLGAQRGVLPLSENRPDSDLLIIIGDDYQ